MGGFGERVFHAQDDLPLYFRDYGDPLAAAVPVLCLPGLTRNSSDFHELAGRLSAGRRVLCPDYRGRGRSARDPDWRNYRPRTYLDDLRHLLALAGVHRVAVIGTSLGGLLAMGLAAAQPTALAGVVLNDIGPEIDPRGLIRILDYVGSDRPQRNWDGAVRQVRTMFPDMFPDMGFHNEAGWRKLARGTYREGEDGLLHFDWDPAIAKPLMRAERIPNLWAPFRALARVPALVLRGAKSDVLSPATLERMTAVKPDLVSVTVGGAGHPPLLDEPESVDAIDDLLSRL